MLLVLFGLPATGKTYVGKVFKKSFGFFLYDADSEIPLSMKRALSKSLPITDRMRDDFFEKVYVKTQKLTNQYPNICIAQTFIKETYRKQLLSLFPDAKFILVKTKSALREKRLTFKKRFPLTKEYAKRMDQIFEKPHIKHLTITNNIDGKTNIKNQGRRLLKKMGFDQKIN